jgi:hypothetical protein
MAVKHPMKRVPRELWGVVDAVIAEYRKEKDVAARSVEEEVIGKLMNKVTSNG